MKSISSNLLASVCSGGLALAGSLCLVNPSNLMADLSPAWTFNAGDPVHASSCLGRDGTIYLETFGFNVSAAVMALNPGANTLKWTSATSFIITNRVDASLVLTPDDATLYVTAEDGVVRAVNTVDGTLKWQYPPAGSPSPTGAILSAPALGKDGTVYVADHVSYLDGLHWYLLALNPNGTLKWSTVSTTNSPGKIIGSPAIGADGTIYVGTSQTGYTSQDGSGVLYAFTDTGSTATLKWQFPSTPPTFCAIDSSITLGADGTIYFGTHVPFAGGFTEAGGPHLWAVNPDGSQKWAFQGQGGSFDSSAAIGPDDTVYVGEDSDGGNGIVFAINPDGTFKAGFTNTVTPPTGATTSFESSPALAADGTLYIGCNDLRTYAFDTLHIANQTLTLKWQSTQCGGALGPCDGTLCETGFESSPVITSSGNMVYIGAWDNNLYAFSQTNGGAAISFWSMYRENRRHSGDAVDNRWTESPAPVATIKDLGTFDNGSDYSYGYAVNDLRNVTGNSQCVSSGTTYDYAFWYTPAAGMTDLGGLCTAKTSSGLGINLKNVIVGYAYDCYNVERAFAWSIGNPLVQLSAPSGFTSAVADGINNAGEIIGSSVKTSSGTWHAAFWPNSSTAFSDLGTLGGYTSSAYGIDSRGWVVGYSTTNTGSAVYHGFLTLSNLVLVADSSGGTNDLGTMSGTFTDYSAAFAINGIGQIAGFSGSSSGSGHAFLKAPFSGTSAGYLDLGVTVQYATLNGRGQVVGYDGTSGGVWIYAPALGTSMKKLSNYLSSSDQSAWTLLTATGISSDGCVVGWGYHNGLPRAFMISPNSFSAASGGGGCSGGGGSSSVAQPVP